MHSLPAVCIVAFVLMQYLHHFLLSVECQVVLFHKKGCTLVFRDAAFSFVFLQCLFYYPAKPRKAGYKIQLFPLYSLGEAPEYFRKMRLK